MAEVVSKLFSKYIPSNLIGASSILANTMPIVFKIYMKIL